MREHDLHSRPGEPLFLGSRTLGRKREGRRVERRWRRGGEEEGRERETHFDSDT